MAEGAGGAEVGRISIRVVPNLDKFYRDLEEGLRAADRLEVEIKIKPDFDGLREKVAAETKAMPTAEVKVKPNIDQTEFQRAVAEANLAAKAAGIKLHLDFEDKEAEAKLAETIAKLKLEAKAANIKINIGVDRNTAGRTAAAAGGGLLDGLGDISKGVGSGFKALSDDTTLIALAIVSLAAPALALLSGLLLSLPAIITAVALPIGVLALGFKGIGEAADAAGFLSSGKKGKQGIGPALKAIQDQFAAKFKDGFTPIFKQLAPLLPVVGNALLPIADRVVDIAKALTGVLTSPAAFKAFQTTISSISAAMTAGIPGIKSFSEGLLNLIAGGSRSLPKFAGLFDEFGDRFNNWIKKITREDWTGQSPLDRAMTNFVATLHEILDLIAKLGEGGFDFLKDPKFGDKMKEFVGDVKDLVTNILPSLGSFFMDLVGAIKETRDFVHDITNLKNIGGKDDNGKKATNTFANTVNGPFGSPLLAWTGLGDVIAQQGPKVRTFLSQLKTGMDDALSGMLTFFANLPTQLGSIWDGVVNSASSAWGEVVAVVQGVISQIIGVLAEVPNSVSTAWSGITNAASQAWGQVVSAIQGAIQQIISVVQSGASDVLGVFAALPGQIAGALGGAAGALIAAGKALMDGLLSGIKAGLSAVLDFASGIAAKIAAVKGPLPKDKTVLTPAGRAMMQGLQDGIEGGLQGVLDRARLIAGQIGDAVKDGTGPGAGMQDQLKKSLSELGIEHDQLRVQLDQTTDPAQKKVLQDQLKQVQAARDQLSLQSDQLGFSKKYGDSVDQNTQLMQGMVTKTAEIGKNFAESTTKQFIGDVGGSGNGAIEQVADIGIGWLSSMFGKAIQGGMGGGGTTINVGSVDDALTAHRTIQNRQALQYDR